MFIGRCKLNYVIGASCDKWMYLFWGIVFRNWGIGVITREQKTNKGKR